MRYEIPARRKIAEASGIDKGNAFLFGDTILHGGVISLCDCCALLQARATASTWQSAIWQAGELVIKWATERFHIAAVGQACILYRAVKNGRVQLQRWTRAAQLADWTFRNFNN